MQTHMPTLGTEQHQFVTEQHVLQGFGTNEAGERMAFNTMVYSEPEIERIAEYAFDIAMKRNRRLCSVDKANVLEVSQLWREVCRAFQVTAPWVLLRGRNRFAWPLQSDIHSLRAGLQRDVPSRAALRACFVENCPQVAVRMLGRWVY